MKLHKLTIKGDIMKKFMGSAVAVLIAVSMMFCTGCAQKSEPTPDPDVTYSVQAIVYGRNEDGSLNYKVVAVGEKDGEEVSNHEFIATEEVAEDTLYTITGYHYDIR